MAADLFIALNATKSIVEGNFERKILLLIVVLSFFIFYDNTQYCGALNVSKDFSGNEKK